MHKYFTTDILRNTPNELPLPIEAAVHRCSSK